MSNSWPLRVVYSRDEDGYPNNERTRCRMSCDVTNGALQNLRGLCPKEVP
jgi:hypothetical protein